MRWSAVCLWVLTVSLTSACPTMHRRDGVLDRAAHADTKEQLETKKCDKATREKLCKDNEDSDECLDVCGEGE
ncbi:hypothetical protein JY651_45205 [Pyxidicoccus parkwayensis]|uniref:Lipoprotein n=1 Tax=Pyxidicoccus parkwayensis TaxID=2813578 RepID=A0ABX7P1D1_9BACT|nr:hypothetical protein [Pyxidicoccus parkwaysis]QSQ22253.1 hypothetical protein JY651_45205 [Pyxidicoccus parkwaysis]